MRIGASSGDSVEVFELENSPGINTLTLSHAVEILGCGVRKEKVVLYGLVKEKNRVEQGKRIFIVQKNGTSLPLEQFKYYFFVGLIQMKGWAVFEVV